jgi:hypothetical protein
MEKMVGLENLFGFGKEHPEKKIQPKTKKKIFITLYRLAF